MPDVWIRPEVVVTLSATDLERWLDVVLRLDAMRDYADDVTVDEAAAELGRYNQLLAEIETAYGLEPLREWACNRTTGEIWYERD